LPAQPTPQRLDWDAWCGATELRPYHQDLYTPRANPGWISFRDYSGGEMTGWGAHGLDQVQWALGMDDSGPVEVWTEGEPFQPPVYSAPASQKAGDLTCSQPAVFFRYASGAVLKLADGPPGGAIFIGDRGKITIDRGRFVAEPTELANDPLTDTDVRLYVSNDHLQNWIDCIKSREKPIADVEIGHRSATVCHLGNIARWVGRRLQWDPQQETFVGDDEANRLLDRERRSPYQLPDTV
jgi:predicted dehydrogenase